MLLLFSICVFFWVSISREATALLRHYDGQAKENLMPYNRYFQLIISQVVDQKAGNLAACLENPLWVCNLMNTLGPKKHPEDNILFNKFSNEVGNFTQENKNSVLRFLMDALEMDELCQLFIQYYTKKDKLDITPEETLRGHAYHNVITELTVKQSLQSIQRKKNIHIMGYGCGDGKFELTIAAWLKRTGVAEKVKVYGVDPYAKANDKIHMLNLDELSRLDVEIDIVLSIWVLHHVAREQRWRPFQTILENCISDAEIIIIEHGYFTKQEIDRYPQLQRRLYLLLMGLFDVYANIGLRREQILCTQPLGKDFYVDYLSPQDVDTICGLTYNYNVKQIGPPFPNQSFIRLTPRN